jgi:hypothetical protein
MPVSFQNLLKIGQLKEHPPDAAEVQRLLAAAATDWPAEMTAKGKEVGFQILLNLREHRVSRAV